MGITHELPDFGQLDVMLGHRVTRFSPTEGWLRKCK